MTDIITQKLSIKTTRKIVDILKNAYHERQKIRIDNFLRYIDLNYDVMSVSNKEILNEYIASTAGREILSTYVDGITQTSSERLRMATAILYCRDPDFSLPKEEIQIFINACGLLTDRMIDFYLSLADLKPDRDEKPYARYSISQQNKENIFDDQFSIEQIFSYINILIQNRLLLPDPTSGALVWSDEWNIGFGKSPFTQRAIRLIQKADYLLQN